MKRIINSLLALFIGTVMVMGTAVSASAMSTKQETVHDGLSIYRNQHGLPSFRKDADLSRVAQAQANQLARVDSGRASAGSPSGSWKGGTAFAGLHSFGDINSVVNGDPVNNEPGFTDDYSSILLNGAYNSLGTGVAYGRSGTVYVVANLATFRPPPPPPPPPAPVVQAPRPPAPKVQAPAPQPPAPKPASQPKQQAPKPQPKQDEPKNDPKPKREQEKPKETPKPKETKKPEPKKTEEPKETEPPESKETEEPTPTPTATPSPSAIPTVEQTTKAEMKELKEARASAAQAQQQVEQSRKTTKTVLTYGGIGFSGLGLLSLACLPFLRMKDETGADLISHDDNHDDDDDFGFLADMD